MAMVESQTASHYVSVLNLGHGWKTRNELYLQKGRKQLNINGLAYLVPSSDMFCNM